LPEDSEFGLIELQPEHDLEECEPGGPGLPILEPRSKDVRILARLDDVDRGLRFGRLRSLQPRRHPSFLNDCARPAHEASSSVASAGGEPYLLAR
jgi:hypothetical protein